MAAIALSTDIYRRTGSAVWLSATFFLTFGIAGLLNPIAGLIVDRFDRQRVMVTSDVAGAIVWSILLFGQSPAWLLALGFIASVVSRPFGIASNAAVPNLVGEDDLAWANGTLATAGNTSRILGPVLGGAIAGLLNARYAYVANAASFIASALLVASLRSRFQAARDEETEPGTMWTGFGVIFRDPVLRSLTIVWTVLYLTIDVALVADLPISRSFGWGAFGFGLINAFFGAGALVGGRRGSAAQTSDGGLGRARRGRWGRDRLRDGLGRARVRPGPCRTVLRGRDRRRGRGRGTEHRAAGDA
jgi:MFS family permease